MPIERLTKNHLVYMNIGKRFWGATLDQLKERQLNSVLFDKTELTLGAYIENLQHYIKKGIGLFLWGNNSRGKSYISAAFCKRVWGAYRVTSYCITASELKDAWIEDRPAHEGSSELLLHRASNARFLVIDDIGKEHRAASGFAENKFGQLLRERVRSSLVTCLTSNLDPKEFSEVYGRSTAELVKEALIPVKIEGENMRNGEFRKIQTESEYGVSKK